MSPRKRVSQRGAVYHERNRMSKTDTEPVLISAASYDLGEIEKIVILKALKNYGGHRARAAQALGINRTTLYNKMRAMDIWVAPAARQVL